MHIYVTWCKIVAFETCVNVPSMLCIRFDPCKHNGVRGRGWDREGQHVFRLVELILKFVEDQVFSITAKGKWKIIES